MAPRRKTKAETELIKACFNDDQCVRLSQMNIELTEKLRNTERELSEVRFVLNETTISNNSLNADFQKLESDYIIIQSAYGQRTKELNSITSKWWYKLFS